MLENCNFHAKSTNMYKTLRKSGQPWQLEMCQVFPSSPKEIVGTFHMHLEKKHLKIHGIFHS